MAKRKRTSRPSRSSGRSYKPETYGIRFDSLTFLVFVVFVLVIAVVLVAQVTNMGSY